MCGSDLRIALGDFLKNKLRLGPIFLADMGELSVKRVAAAPNAKITGEVIAVFSTVEVRDAVRRAAKELAGSTDSGIRLEIPYFLQPSLKALESVSFNLKQKNPKIKRSIKYDDDAMDLVLDFNSDPEGGGYWRRVTADQAKKMKAKMPGAGGKAKGLSDQELDDLIQTS